jgi:hypothetical protein
LNKFTLKSCCEPSTTIEPMNGLSVAVISPLIINVEATPRPYMCVTHYTRTELFVCASYRQPKRRCTFHREHTENAYPHACCAMRAHVATHLLVHGMRAHCEACGWRGWCYLVCWAGGRAYTLLCAVSFFVLPDGYCQFSRAVAGSSACITYVQVSYGFVLPTACGMWPTGA